MDSVRQAAASTAQFARVASTGVAQAINTASDVAARTKLEIQQAYLERQTKMKVDFVQDDVRAILARVDQSQSILNEIVANLAQRAQTQAEESVMFEKSTKLFTSLSYELVEAADSPAASLADLYNGMIGAANVYGLSLAALRDSLAGQLRDELDELVNLRAEFNKHVQEFHVARMQTQLIRQQGGDDSKVEEAATVQSEAQLWLDRATQRLTAHATQLLTSQQLLVTNAMQTLLSIEQAYAQSRIRKLAGRKLFEEPSPSYGTAPSYGASSVIAGEYLMLPMSSTTAGHFS